MNNYNLFSVLGVILVLAFVFTGIAIADPDEEIDSPAIADPDEEKKQKDLSKPPDDGPDGNASANSAGRLRIPVSQYGIAIADPDEEKKQKTLSKPPDDGSDGNASANSARRLRVPVSQYGNAPAKPAAGLRVKVSQFRPSRSSAGTVVFTWTTKSEIESAGFNILRSETRNGPFKPINSALIHGAGTTKKQQTYHWTDASAKPNVVYYYQLEAISFAGTRHQLPTVRLHGHVSASGKLSTKWATLRARR